MTVFQKSKETSTHENPEAIAKFAQSARGKDGVKRTGVNATAETAAIPSDPKLKQETATAVLREGVIGDDEGSEELIKQLPDPILDHHK